ncbi:uncharacterized protein LOC120417160 [Culex pipiens pallens]|uniref:uncharacterized protein LOC120417160 n=1 Tax=Culex pipiens pallens TaxID=42434 RepID=UPI00195329EF|nr:uncharacterized protein LOC120417160 [Culex pipiens pallens]
MSYLEPDQEHLPGIPKKSPQLPPANAHLATAQLRPDELATSVSFSKEDEVIGNYRFRRFTSQPETSTSLPELTTNGQLLQTCPDDGRQRDHPVLYIAVALQNEGRDVAAQRNVHP